MIVYITYQMNKIVKIITTTASSHLCITDSLVKLSSCSVWHNKQSDIKTGLPQATLKSWKTRMNHELHVTRDWAWCVKKEFSSLWSRIFCCAHSARHQRCMGSAVSFGAVVFPFLLLVNSFCEKEAKIKIRHRVQ